MFDHFHGEHDIELLAGGSEILRGGGAVIDGEAAILGMGAGGWDVAQDYNTMQFAGAGENYPVIKEIQAMYKKEGKALPDTMKSTVYYNRGVQQGALWVEAIRNALKLSHGQKPTPTQVKDGFEMIKGFTLGGLNAPLTITAADHEGGKRSRAVKCP